jgi:hypothetical protein
MNEQEKQALIERYIAAYNAFDIDGMMTVIHSRIEFKNVNGGEVTATASGDDEFRQLAEKSKELFTSRRQTINLLEIFDDKAFIDISFESVPAVDFPDGPKAGETMRLDGRSEFEFRDGKISRITDIS